MQNGVQSLWLNSVFCYPTILHLQNCGQTVLLMRPTSPFLLCVCYGIMMTNGVWELKNSEIHPLRVGTYPTRSYFFLFLYAIMMTNSTWQRQHTKSLTIWHSNPDYLEVA